VRLGNPELAKAVKFGRAALQATAQQFAVNVLPIIREVQASSATSHNC
jgi:hypothetical protein